MTWTYGCRHFICFKTVATEVEIKCFKYIHFFVASLEVPFSLLKKGVSQFFCPYNECTSHWCLVMSLSHGAASISFGAPPEDRMMSIAASRNGLTSSEGEGSAGLPRSGVVATTAPDPELTAMLVRAAMSIGLEVNRPPSSEPSRLVDGFLGAGHSSQPCSALVHFILEVHASALHAMVILLVRQAKVLKQMHKGSSDTGLMQELRTAADFALRAMKVTVRSLWKVMSTMVVQECHLGLNLAEMTDVDKARFLDAPISQAGLFGDTIEGFAQQFSAVQRQTEAIQHILPWIDAPSATTVPGYADCAVGATCTASGGVARATQHVLLAHAHNSTRLHDSVCQATSQVQRRPQDFSGSTDCPCLVRGDCCPPGKGCNRVDPSSRDEAGVLQPLLHRT